MAVVFLMIGLFLPVTWGGAGLSLIYRKKNRKDLCKADSALMGWIIGLILVGGVNCVAVFMHLDFQKAKALLIILVGVVSVISGILLLVFKGGVLAGTSDTSIRLFGNGSAAPTIALALLGILQLVICCSGGFEYYEKDLTPELVNTILTTGKLYAVNPMTGMEFTVGMPNRLKVLGLPFLYACVCDIFHLDVRTMLVTGIQPLVLISFYTNVYSVGHVLYKGYTQEEGQGIHEVTTRFRKDRIIFYLLTVCAVVYMEDYAWGMDGFGLLHCGYRGVVIRAALIMPFVFSMMLRKYYLPVLVAMAAEVVTVWTFYGLGMAAACAVLMLMLNLFIAKTQIGSRIMGYQRRRDRDA